MAAERRKLEGSRGKASIQLRRADEQLGASSRALGETEAALAREQAQLEQLQQRRDALQSTLQAQRIELATLLRAAYTIGSDAPLKLMLAQDRVADASRVLTWHTYLQRQRAQRIGELTAELEGGRLENDIAQKRSRWMLPARRTAQSRSCRRSAPCRPVAHRRTLPGRKRAEALGRVPKLERDGWRNCAPPPPPKPNAGAAARSAQDKHTRPARPP